MNPKINSNINANNKATYLENSSLKNLEEKSSLLAAYDMETDSDLDVAVKSDMSVPYVQRTIVDSVTAVLVVQKLATGNQSLTKLKCLSRSRKNNLLRVLLDKGSDGDLMFYKKGTTKCFPYYNRQVPSLGI